MQHIFWAMEKISIFFREYRTFRDIIDGPYGTKGKEAFSPNSDVDCMVTLRATFVPSFSVKWSHYTTPLPTSTV